VACGLQDSVCGVGGRTLCQLKARQQADVLDAVKLQLQYEPLRNAKQETTASQSLAPWELRVGSLRVFYEVDGGEPDLINVLAIGIKKGSRLIIAGREIHI